MSNKSSLIPGCAAPLVELAPADYCDPVIEAYKKDVDRSLLRENLKLTVEQRIQKAMHFHASAARWRGAGKSPPGSITPEMRT